MGAGIMTPDSLPGGGLGAAILPLAARAERPTTRNREEEGQEGRREGVERGLLPPHAAAAASAPLQPTGPARKWELSKCNFKRKYKMKRQNLRAFCLKEESHVLQTVSRQSMNAAPSPTKASGLLSELCPA